jgi:hypothetical protein
MGKTVEVTETVCTELHRLHGIINAQEAEIARLKGSTTATWSNEQPTEPGHYWLKCKEETVMVLVRRYTETCPLHVLEMGLSNHYKIDIYFPECEWCGPLQIP